MAALIEDVIAEMADPLMPAFIREVATLSRLTQVQEVAAEQALRRGETVRAVLDAEARDGRLRSDLPRDVLAARLELLIEGFASTAANTTAGELASLCAVFRDLVEDAVTATHVRSQPAGSSQDTAHPAPTQDREDAPGAHNGSQRAE